MKRRNFVSSLGALPFAMGSNFSFAQTEPMRLVVPYAAGGQTDVLARMLALSMEKTLKRQILVDNKPGAGGIIGTRFVQQSKPDGSTMLYHNAGYISTALLRNSPPYDPVKDFDFIAHISRGPSYLMVHESVPAKNVNELIAYTRTLPNGIECANSGMNSGGHIAALMLQKLGNMKIIHVPYKGSAEVAAALISGEAKMQISTTTESLEPHIAAGKIRVLAIATSKRSSLTPDIPTIGETIKGYARDGWFGILGPARIPAATKETIASAIQKALAEPEIIQKYREMLQEPLFMGPEAFRKEVVESVAYQERMFSDLAIPKT